jgi:hypothetical protein
LDKAVGPVLKACGGRVDLIISAIRDDNPDVAVEVVDYGDCVRVRAPEFLRITKATLEWHLGRSFGMCWMKSIMASFDGHIEISSEEMAWHYFGNRRM